MIRKQNNDRQTYSLLHHLSLKILFLSLLPEVGPDTREDDGEQEEEGDVQCVLAQVNPEQPSGAGGRGHGDHRVIVVLDVGDHGHLVAATGEVVSDAHPALIGQKSLDKVFSLVNLMFCPGYLLKVTF